MTEQADCSLESLVGMTNSDMRVPSQVLLFDETPKLQMTGESPFPIPESFYVDGFFHRTGVGSPEAAQAFMDDFIRSLDCRRLPMIDLFKERLQLAKVARIPSRECQDAITTPFLALHFEMGLPLIHVEEDTILHLFVCLYFPPDVSPSETRTRLFPIHRLRESVRAGGGEELESQLRSYARSHGDGWGDYNSGRLSCLGRFVDAMRSSTELSYMRDYRIAEWFTADEKRQPRDGNAAEKAFFAGHGVNIDTLESRVHLKPGDVLIIDNTRTAHGRSGYRGAESIYQCLYSVSSSSETEIDLFRRHFAEEVLSRNQLTSATRVR